MSTPTDYVPIGVLIERSPESDRLHANESSVSNFPLFRLLRNLLPSYHSDPSPRFVPKYGRTTRSPYLDQDLVHISSARRNLLADRQE